jgi:predicted ATP-grasp superfamily ATP-dependent carboligase
LFPPCWQKIQPPHFDYAGGSVIQEPDLRARATDLVASVVDALPRTRGLIGVDIVLGEEQDGSADFAIEVNPRLTTSYVGLRCVSDQNLAHAMLASSIGEAVDLSFRLDRLDFVATGKVRRHDPTA